MTVSDKTTVAKILGLSKALQYLKSDDKKVKELCAEIDGLAEGLLAVPEQKEKIVEHIHHYDHNYPWYTYTTTTNKITCDSDSITCNNSNDEATSSCTFTDTNSIDYDYITVMGAHSE